MACTRPNSFLQSLEKPKDVVLTGGMIVAFVMRKYYISIMIPKGGLPMTDHNKRYHIKSACPQCGCSFAQVLSGEELKKKYGDMPNVELECGECMIKFQEETKKACPEWDKDCRLEE